MFSRTIWLTQTALSMSADALILALWLGPLGRVVGGNVGVAVYGALLLVLLAGSLACTLSLLPQLLVVGAERRARLLKPYLAKLLAIPAGYAAIFLLPRVIPDLDLIAARPLFSAMFVGAHILDALAGVWLIRRVMTTR